eukprot:1137008-Pelagomonas_calceolata.AAC.6
MKAWPTCPWVCSPSETRACSATRGPHCRASWERGGLPPHGDHLMEVRWSGCATGPPRKTSTQVCTGGPTHTSLPLSTGRVQLSAGKLGNGEAPVLEAVLLQAQEHSFHCVHCGVDMCSSQGCSPASPGTQFHLRALWRGDVQKLGHLLSCSAQATAGLPQSSSTRAG